MGGVSTSCLRGQAATNYVSPHNYQVIFEKPNTIHQFTLVSGRVDGTGNDGFEWEGTRQLSHLLVQDEAPCSESEIINSFWDGEVGHNLRVGLKMGGVKKKNKKNITQHVA